MTDRCVIYYEGKQVAYTTPHGIVFERDARWYEKALHAAMLIWFRQEVRYFLLLISSSAAAMWVMSL